MVQNNSRGNLNNQDTTVRNEGIFDDSSVFEWDSDEFVYHEKGKNWVLGLVVAAIIFVVIFVLLKNYLGIGITILLAIVIYQYAFKKPKLMHFVITKDGLLVGDKFYEFKELKSYWISLNGVLYIDTRQYIPPRLSISLNSIDIESLDRFLAHYLAKIRREGGDSADNLSRWLRL